ncbi:hypothetical protein CYMTET_7412 [Cymbomonas tetramitiformis]|uniref:Complex 1 LYR protein domain-containing protein n=1 Tax=Cymbomonas tetramitiformis TaxID=36881 RepID=A0AAE0GV23_9CHLO|nr:hypothetical protein CYMTET_7412 [Cymbomonas tetramitiformis]
MSAPTAVQAKSLFRALLREGKRFQHYNVREYTLRRARESFRQYQNADEALAAEAFTKGKQDFELTKRQVLLYNTYHHSTPSVMELKQS